ncbi:MAG: hypothetical protein BMS9Abin36_0259 [Gammaproteobacteria bacterium]|nr:MAG: hypothetical protein BMS9Abin36_0259 [Gammaproteobacteria bacterium]
MQRKWIVMFISIWAGLGVAQAAEVAAINPNAGHVERWNWFADATYALHQRLIKGRDVRIEESVGGYHGEPEYYREEKFFDKKTGKLISTIQWEKKRPDNMHAIEVTVRDNTGKVLRDFSALYLTHLRNAPQQTLINLYAHNKGLSAYRQFDASDNRIGEACRGQYQGKKVDIELGEMEILDLEDDPKSMMFGPLYKTCFKGLTVKSAGKYLTPQ